MPKAVYRSKVQNRGKNSATIKGEASNKKGQINNQQSLHLRLASLMEFVEGPVLKQPTAQIAFNKILILYTVRACSKFKRIR